MKLFNSAGPNPHVVRMFAAEKGIALELVPVDLRGGENRREAHLARNPAGQLPTLQLDDGSYLAEVTAICEYLDEKSPPPSLVGTTPEQRAETRMWTRRVDLNIVEPMGAGFRYAEGLAMFKDRITVLPEAAEGLKRIAREKLAWLDGLMDGKAFLCGERLTLADILLYCFLNFGKRVGQPLDPGLARLNAWYGRMDARPSAKA
jgi:glutathione S-transferase